MGSYFINYHSLILFYTQMLKLYSGTIATLTNVEQVAHVVKRLPTMWETRVQSLDWEDLLEKEQLFYYIKEPMVGYKESLICWFNLKVKHTLF